MRCILLAAIACALAPIPLAAQTASSSQSNGTVPPVVEPPVLPPVPNGPLGDPTPLEGTQGVDTDVLCMAMVVGPASEERKAGKPDSVLEGAAGYFLGRVAARQDRDAFLASLAKAAAAKFDKQTVDDFKSACVRRYMMAQMDVMFALAQAMAQNQPK